MLNPLDWSLNNASKPNVKILMTMDLKYHLTYPGIFHRDWGHSVFIYALCGPSSCPPEIGGGITKWKSIEVNIMNVGDKLDMYCEFALFKDQHDSWPKTRSAIIYAQKNYGTLPLIPFNILQPPFIPIVLVILNSSMNFPWFKCHPTAGRNLQRRPYSRPGTGSRWSRYSHASPRVPHQRRPKHPPPPSGSPRVGPPRSGGRWSGCSVDCLSGFFREKGSRHGDEIGDFKFLGISSW